MGIIIRVLAVVVIFILVARFLVALIRPYKATFQEDEDIIIDIPPEDIEVEDAPKNA